MPIFDEDLSPEDWAIIEMYDAQEFDRMEEIRHRFREDDECRDYEPEATDGE
jgi:hypothetical protein